MPSSPGGGPTTTSLPGSASLPTTGAAILGTLVAGAGILGLGLGTLVISRRRRNHNEAA